MLLLFLDTETSGVNFQTDQIIEIGGLIVDLDPKTLDLKILDKYESLVALRQPLDDKITRITGITESDLEFSPKLFTVQEAWLNWLDKYSADQNIEAIIGHTIQFDINFLQNERWFLPEDYKLIDTLHLTKIFFPHLQAVNLEFLIEKLDLKDTLQGYHRSLFDCYSAVKIFKQILFQLQNLPLTQDFYKHLQTTFLPLDLNFFSDVQELENFAKTKPDSDFLKLQNLDTDSNSSSDSQLAKSQDNSNFVEILLNSEPKSLSLSQKINLLNGKEKLFQISKFFEAKLPDHLALILLQLYTITVIKTLHPNWFVKFHSQGQNRDFWFLEIVLDNLKKSEKYFINSATFENEKSDLKNLYILNEPEKLIWQIKNLFEESSQIGKLIEYLDFYNQICSLNELLEQTTLHKILKCISAYEFLLIVLHPFLQVNRYNYNPNNTPNREKIILTKFSELYNCLKDLKLELTKINPQILIPINNTPSNIYLVTELQDKIFSILNNFDFNVSEKMVFSVHKNALFISKNKFNFDLNKHFTKILESYPSLKVESLLDEEDFMLFLEMLNLKKLFLTFTNFGQKIEPKLESLTEKNPDFKYFQNESQNSLNNGLQEIPIFSNVQIKTKAKVDFETVQNIDLLDFYEQKFELAKIQKKSVLVLCGLNSSLKDSQKILTTNFNPSQYLALGETGSITKVSSKLVRNFVGLIVVKVNNFGILTNLRDCPEFAEIWILNQPYFFIHPFWEKQSRNTPNPEIFTKNLKKLFLQYQVQKIHSLTNVVPSFLKGYK